jgi:hypothetical protein
MNKSERETQQLEEPSEDRPLNRIKGFPEINFNKAPWEDSFPAIMP